LKSEVGSRNAEGERAEGVKLGRWEGEKGNWNAECGFRIADWIGRAHVWWLIKLNRLIG
jgi:hypothetical protein